MSKSAIFSDPPPKLQYFFNSIYGLQSLLCR